MGNCIAKLKNSQNGKDVTLLVLGLDNAGKTTTIHGVKGDNTNEVAPTIGFQSYDLHTNNFAVKIFDLGGGGNIRGIWRNYLAEAHGIIFVIDSADLQRLEECRVTFDELISDQRLKNKPVLVLANKQDKPEAIDELELCTRMKLDEVVNRNQCPAKVILCSACPSYKKKREKSVKLDRGIKNGYNWLLDKIADNYDTLKERIDKDVTEQKKKEAEEKELRLERVRIRREQRENEAADMHDRPRPDGLSSEELPNESPLTSVAPVENDPAVNPQNLPNFVNEGFVADERTLGSDNLNNGDSVVFASVASSGLVKETAGTAEHPRALSAASLKEVVRDTPTPTKHETNNASMSDVLPKNGSPLALPQSVASLQNGNDDSESVSSSNTEKKRKKKRKHKKRNKIDPSVTGDTLQGKLAPIRNAPDPALIGKLPPIRATPNYSSEVEL